MDYTGAVETAYHVKMRKEPRTDSEEVTEVSSGIRMLAAPSVEGGSYDDCTPGKDWYPVEYDLRGSTLHGYIAAGCCTVIEYRVQIDRRPDVGFRLRAAPPEQFLALQKQLAYAIDRQAAELSVLTPCVASCR